MTNKEIRAKAKEEIQPHFDSLVFFSVISFAISWLLNAIPFINVFTAPLSLSAYDVYSKSSTYSRPNINNFLKYYRCSWHKIAGYRVRSTFYVFEKLFWFLFICIIASFIPIVNIFALILMCVVSPFIMLFSCMPRYFDTLIGDYIIYKNPSIESKQALEISIEMMCGHRWEAFCMAIGLLPSSCQVIFCGYGLPHIYMSEYMYFDQIYNNSISYNNNHNLGLNNDYDFCEVCGTPKNTDDKFCKRCGAKFE